MGHKYLWTTIVKVLVSILFAGVFYFVWMGMYIVGLKMTHSIVTTVLWLFAPMVTAAGFIVGIILVEKRTMIHGVNFFRIYIWLLIGCAVGFGAVYWFGPMLIVFGMFVAGTASVILREIVLLSRKERT